MAAQGFDSEDNGESQLLFLRYARTGAHRLWTTGIMEQKENWSRTGPKRKREDAKYLIYLASPTGFEPVLSP